MLNVSNDNSIKYSYKVVRRYSGIYDHIIRISVALFFGFEILTIMLGVLKLKYLSLGARARDCCKIMTKSVL